MYYVLALADYEDYQPHWFDCDCTEEEFKQAVTEVMEKVGLRLAKKPYGYNHGYTKKNHGYINGYDMLNLAVRLLGRRGFKLIKPDYEIRMHGMCLYRDDNKRPDVIPEDAWKAIIKHNNDVDRNFNSEDLD